MKVVLVLLLASGCIGGKPSKRILGPEVPFTACPHAVLVEFNGRIFGGGSILNKTHIISSGSLFLALEHPSLYRIKTGAKNVNDTKSYRVKSIKSPGYNDSTHENNLVVVELMTPIDLETIKPVSLPTDDKIPETVPLQICSWGEYKTENDAGKDRGILHSTAVSALDHKKCEDAISNNFLSYPLMGRVHKETFCTKEINAALCYSDDGAGVIMGNKIIGVVSFATCSKHPTFRALFTNVGTYLKFIKGQ